MLERLFTTHFGRIVISVVWGLGLATLFRQVCKGRKCIVIQGPDPEDVKNKIFKFHDKCYTYRPHNVKCDVSNIIPTHKKANTGK